jgi:hypothetical protein
MSEERSGRDAILSGRSCVLEIVDAAPPAPVLQLDRLGPAVDPWRPPRRTAVPQHSVLGDKELGLDGHI